MKKLTKAQRDYNERKEQVWGRFISKVLSNCPVDSEKELDKIIRQTRKKFEKEYPLMRTVKESIKVHFISRNKDNLYYITGLKKSPQFSTFNEAMVWGTEVKKIIITRER